MNQPQDFSKNIVKLNAAVCVVGSGAGGAVVAKELQEAGLDVILVEEGEHLFEKNLPVEDTLELATRLYRGGGTGAILGKPSIMFAEGRVVGGSTFMNGGMCWRTPEKIVHKWQHELGLKDFSNERLQKYFEKVERIINATPQHAVSFNRDGWLLKQGAEHLGFKVKENIRSQHLCVGANRCLFGCPTGAKKTTANTYIPAFLKAKGRLLPNVRVVKVTTQNKRITGVEGYFIDPATRAKGPCVEISAPKVVVSAGAIQTVGLLKRSKIRDAKNHLGRNLKVHPNAKVVAVFPDKVNAWRGVNQSHQITEFFDEGLLMAVNFIPPNIMSMALPAQSPHVLQTLKEEYHHMVAGAALIEDTSFGRVWAGPFESVWPVYHLNEFDFNKAKRAVALLCEVFFSAGATKCYLPFNDLWQIKSINEISKINTLAYKKTDIELMTVHVMGTARMGIDPKSAVVDSYGQFHGFDGLFVADASVFPSSIGVNPQVSIMALATRTAEYIMEQT